MMTNNMNNQNGSLTVNAQ
uniref:Uncharacterized protein n=1 Tax=Arundo donax TaxID=35708 RepID=A0A0A9BM06_ARUDO